MWTEGEGRWGGGSWGGALGLCLGDGQGLGRQQGRMGTFQGNDQHSPVPGEYRISRKHVPFYPPNRVCRRYYPRFTDEGTRASPG